uniref:Rad60/SUMO-like domain-containing protein n=1 Tax=Cyprinus carpio TaxID=7962 RepID=A0A8C2IJK3_CYPCA
MADEKPKEGVKTENDHINLKVAGQDGSVVQFKIKRHTPLSKLMKAYCERQHHYLSIDIYLYLYLYLSIYIIYIYI